MSKTTDIAVCVRRFTITNMQPPVKGVVCVEDYMLLLNELWPPSQVHQRGPMYIDGCSIHWFEHQSANWLTLTDADGVNYYYKLSTKDVLEAKPEDNGGPCPDCKGTGEYRGLFTVEPCRACMSDRLSAVQPETKEYPQLWRPEWMTLQKTDEYPNLSC